MSTQTAFLLLLFFCGISWATDRQNSKMIQWEDRSAKIDNSQSLFPRIILGMAPRTDRKIIFINNKAYDMPEEEQSMLWHLFLNDGFVPETAEFVPEPQMDTLAAALNAPSASGVVIVDSSAFDYDPFAETDHNVLSGDLYDQEYMKASRLVGVRDDLGNETQEEEEKEEEKIQTTSSGLRSTTESEEKSPDTTESTQDSTEKKNEEEEKDADEKIDISQNNKMADVATVQRVSLLYYLWTRVTNLGDMLGRGVVDTLSDTIWTWWLNLLTNIKARAGGKSLPEAMWMNWLDFLTSMKARNGGKSVPEAMWTNWVSFLEYVNSRDLGDPLPELLWESWLTILQALKSRGR